MTKRQRLMASAAAGWATTLPWGATRVTGSRTANWRGSTAP